MKIGRVAGTVVATICSPALENRKLLFVDLLDLDGNETGRDVIAVDAVGAGAGETRATARVRCSRRPTRR